MQGNALSINKLFWALGGNRTETVRNKAVAWEVAYKALSAGIVCSNKDEGRTEAEIPFAEYGAKFWDIIKASHVPFVSFDLTPVLFSFRLLLFMYDRRVHLQASS